MNTNLRWSAARRFIIFNWIWWRAARKWNKCSSWEKRIIFLVMVCQTGPRRVRRHRVMCSVCFACVWLMWNPSCLNLHWPETRELCSLISVANRFIIWALCAKRRLYRSRGFSVVCLIYFFSMCPAVVNERRQMDTERKAFEIKFWRVLPMLKPRFVLLKFRTECESDWFHDFVKISPCSSSILIWQIGEIQSALNDSSLG